MSLLNFGTIFTKTLVLEMEISISRDLHPLENYEVISIARARNLF